MEVKVQKILSEWEKVDGDLRTPLDLFAKK